MKRIKIYCISSLQAILMVFSSSLVLAQEKFIPLQRVVFIDKKVDTYLKYLANKTQARFINLTIKVDPLDSGYIYSARPIRDYESIEDFRSLNWGKWENQIVLIYGKEDLKAVCRIEDSTNVINLKQYAEDLLPRQIVTLPGKKTQELRMNHKPTLTINFKLVKGREIYYFDSSGTDTRASPDELPPVPESNKKQ